MMDNIVEVIDYTGDVFADRTAISYTDAEGVLLSKTYRQYKEDILRLAGFLEAKGIGKNDHVALLSATSYDLAVSVLGIMYYGAVAVPLNNQKTDSELEYEIEFADTALLLIDDEVREEKAELLAEVTAETDSICAYREYAPADFNADSDCTDETAMILFTSGTTGRSKGVLVTHRRYTYYTVHALMTELKQFSVSADGRRCSAGSLYEYVSYDDSVMNYLSVLPLYHIGGMNLFLLALYNGRSIYLCTELKNLYKDIKRQEHSFYTAGTPAFFRLFCKDLKAGRKERLAGLKSVVCMGATLPKDMLGVFREYDVRLADIYGLTEGGGIFNTHVDPSKDDAVGTLPKGFRADVIDGEICLDNTDAPAKYYNNPEADREAFRDGWLHTGDLGRVDEDGYFYLTGRSKNLIILSNGENVSPEELEKGLADCPQIIEAMVKEKDDKICALIYCEKESEETVREFIDSFNKELPPYKRIGAIEFTGKELPKTALKKLKRT